MNDKPKPFKHTVGSLKQFNKDLTHRYRKQVKKLEAMQELAKKNRDLLTMIRVVEGQLNTFDPFMDPEQFT